MEKEMLNLNLQFFAEESKEEVSTEEDYEVEVVDEEQEEVKEETKEESSELEDESDDQESSDVDEEESDDEEESNDEEQEEDTQEDTQEEKKVPLTALQAEREKWKARLEAEKEMAEIGRRLIESTGRTTAEMKADLEMMEIKKLTERGISEEDAKRSIEEKRKLSKEQQKIKKEKQDLEIERLKTDKFYADIESYREDIENLTESKNISIKEAYMLIAGEKKLKEKEYQSQFAKPKKKAPKKINVVSKGEQGPPKTKIRLTKAELAIAEMAGMTAKQYWDSKNRYKK